MKNVLLTILATTLLVLNAEARRDQVREQNQQQRIRQGVQSGELTRHEAKKLRKGQKRIDKMQQEAKEDGVITNKEKAKLEIAQDRQSAAIYRQKHDDQVRKPLSPKPAVGGNESGSDSKE